MENRVIGKIVNTFGLKGELKVLAENKQYQNFNNLKEFFIQGFDEKFLVEKIVVKKDQFAKIKIKNYDDINLVEKFKNHNIFVMETPKQNLQEGEFLVEDLIGCRLYKSKDCIGTLIDVENFGATDIFVLDIDGKEARIPFVSDFIKNIDIKHKKIEITEHFYEGLVE